MRIIFRSRQFGWLLKLGRLWIATALLITSVTTRVLAQSADDPWTEPLNLSHSGVATNPSIVIDSEGVAHAVWQDVIDDLDDITNYMYSRFDGDQWSPPVTTDLDNLFRQESSGPQVANYTGPNPLFVAGPGQYIYAFWVTPQGRLFTSNVENQQFEDLAAWDSGRSITAEAASFAAAVDARGEWHLAYFSASDTPEKPAGIYYTRSENNGGSWVKPVLLYESPYLRRLGEGEANLSIATAGSEEAPHIFIAWDNRPRKQVLLARSTDGGQSWEQPAVVAGPAPGSGLAGPFNIRVGANQDSVVLVWQSGRATNGLLPECGQFYQSSSDAGSTWSDPQPMIEDVLGCAQSNEFVKGLENNPGDPLYFLTETKSKSFLTAWDGSQWSQPQEQSILSGFEEPEIYTDVIYGCHRASLLGERLYVIGCDQGGGGDVWVTSRDLDFKPPVWSKLSPVTSDKLEMEAVEMVATDDGLVHTFYSQHQDPAVYYTYWDGELWSRMTPVLELPEGEAAWPEIAAGPGNELFLVARNDKGTLYSSRATSGKAATESRWSTPTRIELAHDGEIGLVDVAWDANGTVYVVYSVPVNEERGIYLIQSKDHGTAWSEPVQVFNGEAADFDLVGAPSLLISENGNLHIVWTQQSIQGDGDPQPLSLYYTRSEDGGLTFKDPTQVVDEPVAWQEIVEDSSGNVHLLWQQEETNATVWDQVSPDGGNSWQVPQGLPDESGPAAITKDTAGGLHLVGVDPDALTHWLWDGRRWRSETSLGLPSSSQQGSLVDLLAAAVNNQGKMMVVLVKPMGEGDVTERSLLYSTRSLVLPSNETEIQKVPTQTFLPPALTPAAPTPEGLSTSVSTVDSEPTNSQDQTDGNEINDRTSSFTMALIPVALLLLIVLAVVFRRATRVEDR